MKKASFDHAANRATRTYDRLRIKLQNNRLPPVSDEELQLADTFKRKIQSLEIPDSVGMTPAQKAWNENMHDLKRLAQTDDPRNFLSWQVVGGTMFVKYAKYSRAEYKYLRRLPDWNRWKSALVENITGNPVRCPFDTSTSCNIVHHAYHLAQFEDFYNKQVNSFNNVFEFGGGYGSMCRLFFNLGFKGRYLIIDLPAFSMLQEYYLGSIGIPVLNVDEYVAGKSGVLCISELDAIETLAETNTDSLFLATWSISEAPLSVRNRVLDNYPGSFDAYLFAYQPNFEDVNNTEYFEQYCYKHSDYLWQTREISLLPGQKYLFGRKR